MMIEYLGIPGSGKTTIMRQQIEEYKRQDVKYQDLSRYKGMPMWLKVFYKLADYAVYMLPKYKKQMTALREVCKGCPSEPKYLPFSLDYCIKDIVQATLLQDAFGGGKRLVLNDEGQMLRVVFLCVQYGVDVNAIMKCLNVPSLVKTEYVKVDAETAYQRIKARNRHVCPMDELSDERLMEYLKDTENVCELVMRK